MAEGTLLVAAESVRGRQHETAFQRAGHHYERKQPARHGVGPCLPEEGAETLSVCRSSEGLARCGEAGLCSLPLGEPESLPERCRGLFGEPPAHLVDLMHSRFESLIAGAAPEAIMEWAAVDIGLRARLVRAVGRSMLARRFGRCVFVSSSAAECPAGRAGGDMQPAKLAGEALYRSLAVELSGRGITACSLRLSWLDAGRGWHSGRRRAQKTDASPVGWSTG